MIIHDEEVAKRWAHARHDCTPLVAERLERFIAMLGIEALAQNLVSANSLAHVWRRHVADSAQLLDHVPRGTGPWLDLGSGAGFPGVIVAIYRPEIEVVLVESRPLRADWLQRVRADLGLDRVKVHESRLEKIGTTEAGAISARAFAPLGKLLSLSARFSTPATRWTLPKGRSAREELTTLRGWTHMFHVEPSVTDPTAGIIVGHLLGREEPLA